MLRVRGDAAASLREFRAAEEIDGADVTIQAHLAHLGTPYYFLRDYTNAIEQYQKACRLEPRSSTAREFLAAAYEGNRQYKESLDCYEAAEKLTNGDAKEIEARYNRWRSVLAEKEPRGLWETQLLDFPATVWSNPYDTARLHARLGNTNEVFTLLNKARDEHSGGMGLDLDDRRVIAQLSVTVNKAKRQGEFFRVFSDGLRVENLSRI